MEKNLAEKDQYINQITKEFNENIKLKDEQLSNLYRALEEEDKQELTIQIQKPIHIEQIRPRINREEDYRITEESVSQGTRSQGPAIIGQEIVNQVLNEKGEIIWEGKSFKLAGKEYSAPMYALNLIKHNRSNEIKNFKNVFIKDRRNAGDKSSYDDKKVVTKAIEILEETSNHNNVMVAIVMRRLLDAEGDMICTEFRKRYIKDYDRYFAISLSITISLAGCIRPLSSFMLNPSYPTTSYESLLNFILLPLSNMFFFESIPTFLFCMLS